MAEGWLQMATRVLEGAPETAEHGWLRLANGMMPAAMATSGFHGTSTPDLDAGHAAAVHLTISGCASIGYCGL